MDDQLGILLTLLAALAAGMGLPIARRATLHASSFNGLFIVVMVTLPFFLVFAAVSGQLARARELETQASREGFG